MLYFFIMYNLIFCVLLLLNFVLIYTGYKFLGKNKYLLRYHDLFDIFDILYNYHLTMFFFEWPRSKYETISDRIRFYVANKQGFKYKVASFFASILNKVDPGHIQDVE